MVQIVAEELPTFKSIKISILSPVITTLDLSSPGELDLQTFTPFKSTSILSGSITALVVPIAAKTRPQLGSSPPSAHLRRLFLAHALPTSTASLSLLAFIVVIEMIFECPSASAISCFERLAPTANSACSSCSFDTSTPEAADERKRTVSLVDVHPSESIRLKVFSQTLAKISSATALSTFASVITTESMVASDGASIPAPLAIPVKVTPELS